MGQGSTFKEFSDTELVAASMKNSEEAMAALITRYLPLIHTIAGRFQIVGLEQDDFVQEGLIGLLSAIHHYSSDQNCSFNTYARVCILNRMRSVLEHAGAGKNAVLSNAVPIDSLSVEPLTEEGDPERAYFSKESLNEFFQVISQSLSEKEQRVLFFYLEGYEPSQIAVRMNAEIKSVYNALSRIRKKLGQTLFRA